MTDERGDEVDLGELISPRDNDILSQVLQAETVVRVSIEDVEMDVEASN